MNSRSILPSGSVAGSRILRPLVVGMAATSAGSLSADVIYNNNPIEGEGAQEFAINAGDDFMFFVNPGSFGDFMAKPPIPSTPSSVALDPINGARITFSPMAFGDQVDGSDVFTEGSVEVTGSQYYGFSLPGSTTLYGWISVYHVAGEGTGMGAVTEWAYDTTGAAINVGQTTAVPEPASAAAVAALLAGSAAMLRRRQRVIAA